MRQKRHRQWLIRLRPSDRFRLFHRFGIYACCAIMTFIGSHSALAQERHADYRNNITLFWENDIFAKSDRDYTNGLRLTWSRHLRSVGQKINPDTFLDTPLIRNLPHAGDPETNLGVSLAIGHSIYTPRDTSRSELIPEDRPYAGYLYVGLGWHASRDTRLSMWELQLGVVGPWALGEQMQNTAHRFDGSDVADGWENQLNNEPAFLLIYDTKWRGNGWGMGLIPNVGGRLGTIAIDAAAGTEFRFGWRLPDNFGSCPIQSGCDSNHLSTRGFNIRSPYGTHLFVGIREHVVLRDIFLDGNTFSSSHNVDKKTFFTEASAGIAFHYMQFRAIYAYIWRSRQFEQQDRGQIFGSFKISYDY